MVVDLRRSSATYGKHIGVELSADGGEQLFVPRGFAHGFCTLVENTEIFYKVDAVYSAAHDRGVHPLRSRKLGIHWPIETSRAMLWEGKRPCQPSMVSPTISNRKSSMNVLVTGGAGFIGSAYARQLAATRNVSVVNVDKLTYAANLRSLDPIANDKRYAFRQADICDRAKMEAIFAHHKPTAVIHLAAESHVDRSITGADAFLETNVMGTYRLLEVAKSYYAALEANARSLFRFVHVSTDEVYGSLAADGLFCEETPYAPSSPYSASKTGFRSFGRSVAPYVRATLR